MPTIEPSFLGISQVRRAVAEALDAACEGRSFAARGGTRQRPSWRSTVAPEWDLVLEVRSDHGVADVSIELIDTATDASGLEFTSRSWPPSIPWRIARQIGRASDATRHLRIFRGRPYWALEASHERMYVAEAVQLDLYLRLALPELLRQVDNKLARWGRHPQRTSTSGDTA